MNSDLETKIINLRKLGTAYKEIPNLLKSEYPRCSRGLVRKVLIEHNLLSSCTFGGYRSGAGNGISYLIDDYILDSYAELIFYLYRKLTANSVIKNKSKFILIEENKKYYPDFIDVYGNFYEIKSLSSFDYWGWNCRKVEEARKKGFNIIVITKEELENLEKFILIKFTKEELNKFKLK